MSKILAIALIFLPLNVNAQSEGDVKIKKIHQALALHIEILHHIENGYYKELDIFECSEKIERRGVSNCTDSHSFYLNPEEKAEEEIVSSGELGGIGATLLMKKDDAGPTITDIIEASPAEKEGLKIEDMIIAIATDTAHPDWLYLKGLSVHESVKLIRGQPGTTLILKIVRKEESMDFKITRALVKIKYLSSKKIGSVGYIRLRQFFGKDLSDKFYETLSNFKKENISAVIIDLRNNGGGRLNDVIEMAGYFKNGPIVHEKWRDQPPQLIKNSKLPLGWRPNNFKNFKVVILQNKNSASASEILSAYLKEDFGAVVVGENSFGKGTIQRLIPLSNGGELHLTVAEYLVGAKLIKVNEVGVRPDIEAVNPEEVKTEADDLQLKRALQEAQQLLLVK